MVARVGGGGGGGGGAEGERRGMCIVSGLCGAVLVGEMGRGRGTERGGMERDEL